MKDGKAANEDSINWRLWQKESRMLMRLQLIIYLEDFALSGCWSIAMMVKQALACWRRLKQKTMWPTMLRVDLPLGFIRLREEPLGRAGQAGILNRSVTPVFSTKYNPNLIIYNASDAGYIYIFLRVPNFDHFLPLSPLFLIIFDRLYTN